MQDGVYVINNFFAYGTLMFEDIMTAVCGGGYASESALLKNYRCFAVRGEVYPGIRPQKAAVVAGKVYISLTQAAWKRLDRFEGQMYRRDAIEVELASGRVAAAQTYVVRPEFAYRLSSKAWSAEKFLRAGKMQFQKHYRGFEALKHTEGDR